MILSDRDIKKALTEGRIKILPKPDLEELLSESSLDFRLGSEFRVFKSTDKAYIDVKDPKTFHDLTELVVKDEHEPFVLHPDEFVLGVTLEEVELPEDLSIRIDGKSSLGRLGIVIHSTAGHVGAGFKGKLALEITNVGKVPVLLYPGMRVGQFVFEQLSSPAEIPYSRRKTAKYYAQHGPEESRIQRELP
jgi:dCTP deaminase